MLWWLKMTKDNYKAKIIAIMILLHVIELTVLDRINEGFLDFSKKTFFKPYSCHLITFKMKISFYWI